MIYSNHNEYQRRMYQQASPLVMPPFTGYGFILGWNLVYAGNHRGMLCTIDQSQLSVKYQQALPCQPQQQQQQQQQSCQE